MCSALAHVRCGPIADITLPHSPTSAATAATILNRSHLYGHERRSLLLSLNYDDANSRTPTAWAVAKRATRAPRCRHYLLGLLCSAEPHRWLLGRLAVVFRNRLF